MGKWLAAGSLALVALLVLLWFQIHAPADAATAEPKKAPEVAAQPAPAAAPTGLTKAVGTIAKAETDTKKFATDSDEFFYAFQDIITQAASKNAMTCYNGGLHSLQRHEKVKFKVKDVIKNGEVTITNVEVAEHTFNDPEMIACMKKEIEKTHWHDDRLPDYEEDDIVLIRPGSLVNKFGKEALSYEGSGPDFTKQHPIANPDQAPSHVQPPQ